jgi:hypothetical protein
MTQLLRIACAARRSVVFATGILALACGRDSIAGPRGTALSGTVALQDAWGNDLNDFSGVAVSIDGLSLHATTDKNGAWHIDDVPAGHRDITLAKPTFGTMRILGEDITGSTTVTDKVPMAVTPTVQAVIDSLYVGTLGGMPFYFIDGHLSAPPPANAKSGIAVIFLGKSESVSPSSHDQWNASFGPASSTFTIPLSVDGTRATFGAGTQLFVAAYANSVVCSCYDDPVTKVRVFTNTGPRSTVVRLTVQ